MSPNNERDSLAGEKSEGDTNISPLRERWQTESIDDATRELLADDARYFLQQSLSTPCLNGMQACEGIWITDTAGRRYMDFHGNNVHQVGFANPAVIEAVKQQLDEMSFCTRRYTNKIAVDLARKLAEITPGNLCKTLLCPSGTGAIGMALKLARVATGRHKFVSMWDSFHGASLDAISVGGEAVFRSGVGPLLPGCEHVPPADAYRCLWDCSSRGGCDLKCASYLEYVLEHERDVAAVIAEPVRSTPYIPPSEYWQMIRKVCDRHGTLLIFDEICHGLGRTGRMFTCEHFGVTPDILVLGKGLGGGIMPLAAIVAREGLDVAADRALGHYTHEKSPVACAAALATIRTIEEQGLVENARRLGERAVSQLRAMMPRHRLIGDVRGLGLLIGVELVTDRQTKARATVAAEEVMYRALAKGLSFKLTMGNILTLTPPLIITQEEMDRAIAIVDECLTEVS